MSLVYGKQEGPLCFTRRNKEKIESDLGHLFALDDPANTKAHLLPMALQERFGFAETSFIVLNANDEETAIFEFLRRNPERPSIIELDEA